jgi:hypothetical protein
MRHPHPAFPLPQLPEVTAVEIRVVKMSLSTPHLEADWRVDPSIWSELMGRFLFVRPCTGVGGALFLASGLDASPRCCTSLSLPCRGGGAPGATLCLAGPAPLVVVSVSGCVSIVLHPCVHDEVV